MCTHLTPQPTPDPPLWLGCAVPACSRAAQPPSSLVRRAAPRSRGSATSDVCCRGRAVGSRTRHTASPGRRAPGRPLYGIRSPLLNSSLSNVSRVHSPQSVSVMVSVSVRYIRYTTRYICIHLDSTAQSVPYGDDILILSLKLSPRAMCTVPACLRLPHSARATYAMRDSHTLRARGVVVRRGRSPCASRFASRVALDSRLALTTAPPAAVRPGRARRRHRLGAPRVARPARGYAYATSRT
jgi:hypothetical protein